MYQYCSKTMLSLCLIGGTLISGSAFGADVGDHAPSWTARNPKGGEVSSKKYEGQPVLLVFYRGVTCIHCMQQLSGIAEQADEFKERGIQVIAISAELPSSSQVKTIRQNRGIKFPMLTDGHRELFRTYGCLDRRKRDMHGLFLIDNKGVIQYESVTEGAITDIDLILSKCDKAMQK